MFLIEDEAHDERQEGQFLTREQAIAELERRAAIPWNDTPNRAPCTNWRNCGRRYELVEYDEATTPRKELSRTLILEISAAGVQWHCEQGLRAARGFPLVLTQHARQPRFVIPDGSPSASRSGTHVSRCAIVSSAAF